MGYDASILAQAGILHFYALSEEAGAAAAQDGQGALLGAIATGVTVGSGGFVDGEAAMRFDGVAGKVTFTGLIVPALGAWRCDFWFKATATGGTIVKISDSNELYLGTPLGGLDAGLYMAIVGAPGFAYIGDVSLSTWYYVVCGFDGSASICADVFYPDGSHSGGGTGGLGPPTGTTPEIGHGAHGYFTGLIQKVAFYSDNSPGCQSNASLLVGCPGVPCAGKSLTFAVTPSDGSTILYTASASWLHVSGPASGAGTVTVVVDSNAGGGPRSGFVTVADKTVAIQQLGGC